MVSTLQNAIEFLREFGLFDVVLPFLLVFAIVFALLEKTRILGEEKDGMPKRSLNSTVAFVVALLVVATNKVVTAINIALPNVVLLVVLLVCFLMLVGLFYKEGEFDFAKQYKGWTMGFMVAILIFILLIFADSIGTESGRSWLDVGWEWLITNFSSTVVGTIVMLIIFLGSIAYIMGGRKSSGGES